MTRHLLAVSVESRRNALSAICVELARRRVDVVSLNTVLRPRERGSCVQIVVDAPESAVEMLVKRLNRLVDVVRVVDLTHHASLQRLSMLVTLRVGWCDAARVMDLVHRLRADVIESGPRSTTVFISTNPECRAEMMKELSSFGVVEVVESAPFGTRRIRNIRRHASQDVVEPNAVETA